MYVFLREWLLIGKPDMYIITILAWYYTFSLTSQQILVDNKVYHQMRCECELDFHTSPFQEICLLKNPSENKNPFIWNFSWKKNNIFWPFDIGATLPNDLCWPTAVSSCRLESFWNAFTYFFSLRKARHIYTAWKHAWMPLFECLTV